MCWWRRWLMWEDVLFPLQLFPFFMLCGEADIIVISHERLVFGMFTWFHFFVAQGSKSVSVMKISIGNINHQDLLMLFKKSKIYDAMLFYYFLFSLCRSHACVAVPPVCYVAAAPAEITPQSLASSMPSFCCWELV